MSRYTKVFISGFGSLLFFSLLSANVHAQATWIHTQGPGTAEVRSLEIASNGVIFVTTDAGVEFSSNLGESWKGYVYRGRYMAQAAFSPGSLLYFIREAPPSEQAPFDIPSYDIQVWDVLENGFISGFRRLEFPAYGEITNLPVAEDGSGYFGIGHTVWYYVGWGNGWSRHEVPGAQFNQIFWSGEGEAIAATSKGLYAFEEPSKQTGIWRVGPDSMAFTAVHRMSDSVLVAGAEDGHLHIEREPDFWEEVLIDNTPIKTLAESSQETWLAGTGLGIYRSVDAGQSWSGPLLPSAIKTIQQHPVEDIIFALTEDGKLYISRNDGESWERKRWVVADVGKLTTTPDGGLLVSVDDSFSPYGLQHYDPETGRWSLLGFTEGNIEMVATALDGSYFVLYCPGVPNHASLRFGGSKTTATPDIPCELHRSTDSGESWMLQSEAAGFFSHPHLNLAAFDQNELLAISREENETAHVWRSEDGGATWDEDLSLKNSGAWRLLHRRDGKIELYSNQEPVLRSSTDRGKTWRQVRRVTRPEGYIQHVKESTKRTLIARFDGTGKIGPNLYRSTDDGISWYESEFSDSLVAEYFWVQQLLAGAKGELYARFSRKIGGEWEYGLLESKDDGLSWQQTDVPLNPGVFDWKSLALDENGRLYISTERGVYKLEEPVETLIENVVQQNDAILSLLIYPNPTAKAGQIQLETTQSGLVTLEIYDVLGRKRVALLKQYMSNGQYNIPFEINLPAGVYFLSATLNDVRITRRLVIAH